MTESNSPKEAEAGTEMARSTEQAGNGRPSPSPPGAQPATSGSANGSARDTTTPAANELTAPPDGVVAAAPPPWMRVSWEDQQADAPPGPVSLAESEPAEPVSNEATATQPVNPPAVDAATRADPRFGPPTGPVPVLDSPLPGPGWSAPRSARARQPRQAHLQLKRLDPWSVLKLSLVLAVVLFLVWMVAVAVLYGVLDGMGVWDQINVQYNELAPGAQAGGESVISVWRVLGFAAVVGAINSVLFAVAATITAFVYNVSSDLVGGIELTLSERD